MNFLNITLVATAATIVIANAANAHGGRRFQIEVADDASVPTLRAQGVNTVGVPIDPAGPRPYYNAIHDHFSNIGGDTYLSTLPGYDMGVGTEVLDGHDVTWTLVNAFKWENVDDFIDPTTGQVNGSPTPNFVPLADGQGITVSNNAETVSTSMPGVLNLVNDYDGNVGVDSDGISFVPGGGSSNGFDMDLVYLYTGPTSGGMIGPEQDTIFIIESVLSTDAPGVADSESVYTLFSPTGMGPAQRLHFASLYVENFLGTPVPEPTTAGLLGATALVLLRRRRAA